MNRFFRTCLLFIISFIIGMQIAPLFRIESETIEQPDSRPVQQHRDRYGEPVTRKV